MPTHRPFVRPGSAWFPPLGKKRSKDGAPDLWADRGLTGSAAARLRGPGPCRLSGGGWATRAAPARPAGWFRRDKASRSARPRRGVQSGWPGDKRGCRSCRGRQPAMPVSQKPRHGALGGMNTRNSSMAATPAARAEVMTHSMPPPAGQFEEDQLGAEADAGQRAQQQRGWWVERPWHCGPLSPASG